MLIFAIIIFSIAALLGAYLLSYLLMNHNTPKGVIMIHGAFAATGIVTLLIYWFTHSSSPGLSLLIFVLAALGGFYLTGRDIFGKTVPKSLALGHGLIALSAFILLVSFVYSG